MGLACSLSQQRQGEIGLFHAAPKHRLRYVFSVKPIHDCCPQSCLSSLCSYCVSSCVLLALPVDFPICLQAQGGGSQQAIMVTGRLLARPPAGPVSSSIPLVSLARIYLTLHSLERSNSSRPVRSVLCILLFCNFCVSCLRSMYALLVHHSLQVQGSGS